MSTPIGTVRGIVYGGLAVGILDALAATIVTLILGGNAMRVWQSVASGLLGKSSYEGGIPTMLFGLLIHFFIAFSVVTVYHLASKPLPMLSRQPLLWGPIYGVLVYFFMQKVVLDIVFPDRPAQTATQTVRGILIHVIAVGLPAALSARGARARPRPVK